MYLSLETFYCNVEKSLQIGVFLFFKMIIISLTTSDSSHAAKNAEFYFQPNRLNVAITRPKSKRIIIGSKYLFAAEPKSVEHCEWVRLFRELYEQCEIIQVKNKN